MTKHVWPIVCLLVLSLSWPGKALAQTPSPEALAAAKEFVVVSKMGDQVNNMLPQIMQQLKPLVVRGNPQAERDFDALIPVVMAAMTTHLDAFLDASAQIYAQHFTADEIRELTTFYRTALMQKFLREQPGIMQETVTLGNKFGWLLMKELQERMVEELRKRGHNI
jgi:hypothetical protein